MALTEMRRKYLTCIKASMEETEMMIGVALLTKTKAQMLEMIAFLQDHLDGNTQTLTDDQILKKAIEINQQGEEKE